MGAMWNKRGLAPMLLIMLGLLGASPGRLAAQPAYVPGPVALVEQALRDAAARRFEEAAAAFEAAAANVPMPELGLNVAIALEEHGKAATDPASAAAAYARAAAHYAAWGPSLPAPPAGLATRIADLEAAAASLRASPPPSGTPAPLGFAGTPPAPLPLLRDLYVIESSPSGATISLGSIAQGPFATTPWAGQLSGAHQLMIEARGLKPELAMAAPGHGLTMISINLTSARGLAFLLVRANVAGAYVELDGRPLGIAPNGGSVLPGRHALRVSASGYDEVVREVDLAAGEEADVTVELTRVPTGYLEVRGEGSPDADVFVDGQRRCQPAPCRKALGPGTYEVRVTRPGYLPVLQRVTIADQVETSLAVDFAPRRRRWDAVATAALAGGLIGTGAALGLQDGRGYQLAAGSALGLGTLSLGAAIYLAVRPHRPSRAAVSTRALVWAPTASGEAAGMSLAGAW